MGRCDSVLLGNCGEAGKQSYEDNEQAPHWIKFKNPAYSQKEGRADLFKKTLSRGRISGLFVEH